MQPDIEHILGEFNVVLQSIGMLSIAEGLIEALDMMS
jgi:hypothetical protein